MATRDLYVAVWEKSSGPPWAARHGLTSAAYQTTFNQMTQQGYRPRVVCGYSINGQDRYAAIWEKSGGPAWAARHGLTSDAYKETLNQMPQRGYRPRWVVCYAVA